MECIDLKLLLAELTALLEQLSVTPGMSPQGDWLAASQQQKGISWFSQILQDWG